MKATDNAFTLSNVMNEAIMVGPGFASEVLRQPVHRVVSGL